MDSSITTMSSNIQTRPHPQTRPQPRHHFQAGVTCGVCLVDFENDRIVLHKTRRITHEVCLECAEKLVTTQLFDNLKARKFETTIKCCGTFTGNTNRNKCSHLFEVKKLPEILWNSKSVQEFLKPIIEMQRKNHIDCPQCGYVYYEVSENYSSKTTCKKCTKTWCKDCRDIPYHSGIGCGMSKILNMDPALAELIDQGVYKRCPGCNNACDKIDGCNHIVCNCRHNFCWLCGQTMDPSDPYKHFRLPGPCHYGTFR